MNEATTDRRRRSYNEKSVKILITEPRGFMAWFKRTCKKEKISVSEGFRRPYLGAWRSSMQDERVNPVIEEKTVVASVVPTPLTPLKPKSLWTANPCIDCANKLCAPTEDPCKSCDAPNNPSNWKKT